MLPVLPQGLHRLPVQQAKVGAAGADMGAGQCVDQAVIQSRALFLEPGNPLCILAYGLHHMVAFLPLGQKLRQQFRRVLHIPVHGNHGVPFRMVEAASQGNLMAAVAGEGQHMHIGKFCLQILQ